MIFLFSRIKYEEWLEDHPVTIIQFLFYLYHNLPDWMPAFMTSEILHSLSATLFPFTNLNLSEPSTPNDDCFINTADGTLPLNVQKDNLLTLHPSRKFVIDFLRVIVVDSLLLPINSKSLPPLDLVLDVCRLEIIIFMYVWIYSESVCIHIFIGITGRCNFISSIEISN